MDILNNFGFEPVLFAAQVVNFLVILFLLQKFALKPILKLLDDRKQTIAEGFKNAETAQKALTQAVEEEKKIIRSAQQTSEQLIDTAKKQAKEIVTLARQEAKEQVEEIIESARAEMAQEQKKLEKELAVSVARTAVNMVEKALVGLVDQKDQQKVVEKFTEKLKKQV